MPRGSYNQVKLYKFYFAFENTIADGYTTEKLYSSLTWGPIPVYLGNPMIMNITKTPSFINVHDFRSPKALSDYLIFLSKNPEEYNKYHEWRRSPDQFTDEYLKLVAEQLPGPEELEVHEKFLGHKHLAQRRALCCRLCNLDFVAKRIKERDLVSEDMTNFKVRRFFPSSPFL